MGRASPGGVWLAARSPEWSARVPGGVVIDLHTHILPALDDGAKTLAAAVAMARMAVADGITHVACTPHVMPGTYDNDTDSIERAFQMLSARLGEEGVALALVMGADIHATPDLLTQLQNGRVPTIAGGRYFLFEPPHHVIPPGIDRLVRALLAADYVPILTHPERLTWIEQHYDIICALDAAGIAIQLTAASITGGFGSRAQYWSKRLLDEGRVDVIASDAHDTARRPPVLSWARDQIAKDYGAEFAASMTLKAPLAILRNEPLPPRRRKSTDGDGRRPHRRIPFWRR